MPIVHIMENIVTSLRQWRSRGFTLLESLLTLSVVSFLSLLFVSTVHLTLEATRESIFWTQFEDLYESSQILAVKSQQEVSLQISENGISNGKETLALPDTVHVVTPKVITFTAATGGNSSLEHIQFQSRQGRIRYQLYLGSGRYRKTSS